MKPARMARDRMREAAATYDSHLSGLLDAAKTMRECTELLRAANHRAVEAGFDYLRLRAPEFNHEIERGPFLTGLQNLSPTGAFKSLEGQGKL